MKKLASSTLDAPAAQAEPAHAHPGSVLALVIVWCREDPSRVGEVAFLREGEASMFGRGDGGHAPRVEFARQRGGLREPPRPFASKRMSRDQLELTARAGNVIVRRRGRCGLRVASGLVDEAEVGPGDTLHVEGELTFLCTKRDRVGSTLRHFPTSALGGFGLVDRFGLIGESPAMHRLREALAWHAKATEHVLILGASGVGKELAARALHAMSTRARAPFVARNAATIPSGLVDAELFGNLRNYPNAGAPERPGLLGEAQGGVLFLDEIAEVPESVHAHLLRVLDERGEYHRLGESLPRRADVRLFAATNRGVDTLKHDLAARLPLRLVIPGLEERREDIPLIAGHLLRGVRKKSAELAARFFDDDDMPRFSAEFIDVIMNHRYTTHVRELSGLLWRALADSSDDVVVAPRPDRPPSGRRLVTRERSAVPERVVEPVVDVGEGAIRAAIKAHGGNATAAAKELGFSSRFALYRRMKKLGLEIAEARNDDE